MNGSSWAVDFETEKTMAEILAVAKAVVPVLWHEREKDAFGPYLWASLFDGCAVRIYDLDGYYSNGPTYTIDMRVSDAARKAEIEATVTRLLDAIGARNRKAGEYYD